MQKKFLVVTAIVVALTIVTYVWKSQAPMSVSPVGPEAIVAAPAQDDAGVAEGDCSVDRKTLMGAIDVTASDIGSVEKDALEGASYVQQMTLKDGSKVEYVEGGCVHFSYHFSFSPYHASPNKMDWIQEADKFLTRAIFNTHGLEQLAALKEALTNPDMSEEGPEESLALNCGDATCELNVSENKLTLSYDFAL